MPRPSGLSPVSLVTPTWTQHLDRLEEWVRRVDDPEALPPATAPVGVPEGAELLRAKALLAAMTQRETELRRQQEGLTRAHTYLQV